MLGTLSITVMAVFSLGFSSAEFNIDCGTISFKTSVANETFHRQRLNAPPTDRLEINYTITFTREACCPIIALHTDTTLAYSQATSERRCYKEKNFNNVGFISQFYIYGMYGYPNSGCIITNDTYICTGTRMLFTGTITNWWIDLGHRCSTLKQLDIHVDLTLKCAFPIVCEDISLDYCKTRLGYNKTMFPNAIGQSSQVQANLLFEVILGALRRTETCYQHMIEFMCYSLFPKCSNRGPYLPCKKGCEEGIVGCADYLLRFGQPIYCGAFPDTLDEDVCFYRTIRCPILEKPRFGRLNQRGISLFNKTEYFCEAGYKLEGDAIRYCGYDGMWNGTVPTCVPKNHKWIITGPTISLLSLCILIAVIVTCAYKWNRIKDFIRYYDFGRRNFYQVNKQQKNLFLTYSSEDRDRVEGFILPRMKIELPRWNILTYQENFIGGDSLIKSIQKGIWENHVVLAFLTPNYIDSEFCNYEFREAQTRSIVDEGFRFIVFFDEGHGMEVLKNDMPVSMRTWLKARLYLTLGEYKFWEKLRRGLSK